MNFGLGLLIMLGSYLVVFGGYLLVKKIYKKITFKEAFLDIDNLYRFGLFLLLTLIFLLIICIGFARTTYLTIILLGLCSSLSVIVIPFKSLISKIKNKQFKEINYFKVAGHFLVVLMLILEVSVFSNVGSKKDDNIIDVPFNSSLIVGTDAKIENDKITFDDQRQYIILDNRDHNISSIYLDFDCEVENKIQLDVFTQNDKGEYVYRFDYKFDPYINEFEYFNLEIVRESDYIKLVVVIDERGVHFSEDIPSVTLKKISINQAFPFVFNAFRFVLISTAISLLILVIYKGKELKFKETNNIALVQKIILLLCGVGLIYVLINALVNSSTHFVENIDFKNQDVPIYYQLFDALKKGQAHLDYEPSESLLNCLNPYEPSNRYGVTYLWDHAFYNGKYYCYYGLIPVILVMFPIYLLSGMKYIPSILLIQEIGTLFSILVFLLLLTEMVKVFFKKINYPMLIVFLVGALFTSMLMSNVTYEVGLYFEGIYRIPYSYGLCFFFLALLMLFKAFNNSKYRIVYLGLTGLSVVLMMGSRPTLLVGLIIIIPLLLKIVLEKYDWKRKLIDLVPMVAVVISGAILLMVYNYVRFNSVFEFGQGYQLTLTDNTKLAYSVEGVAPTLFHFFLLPPRIYGIMFPNFDYGYFDNMPKYHVYNAGSIGILFFPMIWGLFALPFVFNKEDNIYLRITMYISPVIIFLLAFTTYCFAGVCPRYTVEIISIATLFSFLPLFKMFEKLYQKKKLTSIFTFVILIGVSSMLGFSLLFAGFDGWLEADQHGLVELIRSLFNQYNINISF